MDERSIFSSTLTQFGIIFAQHFQQKPKSSLKKTTSRKLVVPAKIATVCRLRRRDLQRNLKKSKRKVSLLT